MSTAPGSPSAARRRVRFTPATRRFEQAADRGESGAILLLALAFVTIVMVLTIALLGLAKTENASLRAYRLERVRRYNVDAALQEAIQMVRVNAKMGQTTGGTTPCTLFHAVGDDVRGGGATSGIFDVTQSSGYITVECFATPTAVSGISSGALQSDGGQGPRDVTFEVRCNYEPGDPVPNGQISCGSGADYKVLARARVRYDVLYCTTTTGCPDPLTRATVPKVVSWSFRREGSVG